MKQEALAAAQEAARQKEEAEKAKAEAVAQQQALAAEADKAKAAAAQSESLRQQAEQEKAELRARLLQQLNSILATRDSARGLIAAAGLAACGGGAGLAACGGGPGLPGRALQVARGAPLEEHDHDPAHRFERHFRGPPAESARGADPFRRCDWQ